jgi:hypothetical protein
VRPQGRASFTMPAPCIYQGRDGDPGPLPVAPIPKVLWTYWNQSDPDAFVRQCLQSWRHHCSDFSLRLVHPGNLHEYVAEEDLPESFDALHPTKQSDWLRLYLVHRHGGYWLDATTVLTRPIGWLDALRQHHRAGFVGFYLEGFTHDPAYPVVESWAFGAPAGDEFVRAWQKEFHHALIEIGTPAYLERLRADRDGGAELLQGIADPAYLLIHVAAQKVLRRHNACRLAVLKAEDTAFFYQNALGWKWFLLYPRLCLTPDNAAPAPLIKLRGGERRHFTQMLEQHGGPVGGSIWQRACAIASTSQ